MAPAYLCNRHNYSSTDTQNQIFYFYHQQIVLTIYNSSTCEFYLTLIFIQSFSYFFAWTFTGFVKVPHFLQLKARECQWSRIRDFFETIRVCDNKKQRNWITGATTASNGSTGSNKGGSPKKFFGERNKGGGRIASQWSNQFACSQKKLNSLCTFDK